MLVPNCSNHKPLRPKALSLAKTGVQLKAKTSPYTCANQAEAFYTGGLESLSPCCMGPACGILLGSGPVVLWGLGFCGLGSSADVEFAIRESLAQFCAWCLIAYYSIFF